MRKLRIGVAERSPSAASPPIRAASSWRSVPPRSRPQRNIEAERPGGQRAPPLKTLNPVLRASTAASTLLPQPW